MRPEGGRLRVLVLSARLPWPPERADQRTVLEILRYVAGRGHEVDLVSLAAEPPGPEARAALGAVTGHAEIVVRRRASSVAGAARAALAGLPLQVGYFRSPALLARAAALLRRRHHHVVYAHLLRTAEAALALPPGPARVLGLQVSQALHCGRLARRAALARHRLLYRLEHALVRPYEARVARAFDRCLVIGPRDRAVIERHGPVPNLVLNPHGVDIPPAASRPVGRDRPSLVFAGVLDAAANVDAAVFLVEEVLPRVRAVAPGVECFLVGRNPARRVRRLARPGVVTVTGPVRSMAEELRRHTVAIDPVRAGAGLQNKLLEAMAAGLPVVATPVANEGIGARPGEHLLVARDARGLAAAVLRLLGDPALRARLATRARQLVEAEWSWERHLARFEAVLVEAAGGAARDAREVRAPEGAAAA